MGTSKRFIFTIQPQEQTALEKMAAAARKSQAEICIGLIRSAASDSYIGELPQPEAAWLAQLAEMANMSQRQLVKVLIKQTAIKAKLYTPNANTP